MWDNSQVNARCANNHVLLLSLGIILILAIYVSLFLTSGFSVNRNFCLIVFGSRYLFSLCFLPFVLVI